MGFRSAFLFLNLFLLLAASVCLGGQGELPEKRALFFHQLSSEFMTVVEPGSPYFDEDLEKEPWVLKVLHFFSDSDYLRNAPSGEPRWTSKECRPEKFEQEVLTETPTEFSRVAEKFQKHLEKCEKEMETSWKDLISNAVGSVTINMDPNHHPFARHVMFHLPNHILLKGLLAMKTDGKRRPLIIFRTGIFSNTQTFNPERFLFMQAFDQAPFNVLVLESLSGSEFVKHNTSFAMGGFDEGVQNYLIAKTLQEPSQPISKMIDSVHMMGMSMGAHGAFFANLLNQINKAPVINSTLAFCPLLNMRDTLDYHMSQGFSMDIMNFWAARRLPSLLTRYPDVSADNFIESILQKIEKDYQGALIAENGVIAGIRIPPSAPGFWAHNDFWSAYKKVQTPALIFATRKDPIVSWFINSGRIEDGRMNFSDSAVKMIALEQGYHCSLAVAYDWHSFATMLQTYFLKFSPKFHMQNKEFRVPLSKEALEFLQSSKEEPILQTQFEVPLGSAALATKVHFQKVARPGLFEKLFLTQMEVQLPLSEMEFPIEEKVSLREEADLLRRWANQNITTKVDGSDLVFNWKITPP